MIHRPDHSPSGIHSVAGRGGRQKSLGGKSRGAAQPAAARLLILDVNDCIFPTEAGKLRASNSQKGEISTMISFEMNDGKATVRIHDDYCESQIGPCISRVNQIVSSSYKRRAVMDVTAPHIQAMLSTQKKNPGSAV